MAKLQATSARGNARNGIRSFERPPSDEALLDAAIEGRLDAERLEREREEHRTRIEAMRVSNGRLRSHLDACGAVPAELAMQRLEERFRQR